MNAFETYQTVPMVALSDMDPYQQIQEDGKTFPLFGEESTFIRLDLSQAIIKSPAHTFFVQLTEDTMVDEGIFLGDLLVVDRAAQPRNNTLIIAYLDGVFTLRRVRYEGDSVILHAANPEVLPVAIEPDMEFGIWGVVRDVLHGVIG